MTEGGDQRGQNKDMGGGSKEEENRLFQFIINLLRKNIRMCSDNKVKYFRNIRVKFLTV